MPARTTNPIQDALKLGQSIWYDGLIAPSEFQRMIVEDGLRGATTNPSIFEKALAGSEYDAEIRSMADKSEDDVYKTIAVKAVQEICDVFLPVFERTKGEDGFVSIEVNPHFAYDTSKTIGEARALHRMVNRKNVMIKIPATKEGIPAIQAVITEGISVNVTLIFAVKRYQEVMNAYITGLELRHDQGKPVDNIASVASFFVSRVDSAIDAVVKEKIGSSYAKARTDSLKALSGKVAIANSKAAYKEFENTFSSYRFRRLKVKGAQAQRPLWASTGTKNPAYSDVLYVEALIGPNTVNTVPPPTLDAFRSHGIAVPQLTKGIETAQGLLKELMVLGIDLGDITNKLEDQGVKLFCEAYDKIIQGIKAKRQ